MPHIIKETLRNYLRVRGEYKADAYDCFIDAELPPRARRILLLLSILIIGFRTTSACAENTIVNIFIICMKWNYLRVRGEYWESGHGGLDYGELPPRARRIQSERVGNKRATGTTSACAENTRRNFA